jgi:hypothetical protein
MTADPQKYRDKAERLRREALQSDQPDIRSTMVDVAELYDRLADRLKRQQGQEAVTPLSGDAAREEAIFARKMAAAAEPGAAVEGDWLDIAESFEDLADLADRKASRKAPRSGRRLS